MGTGREGKEGFGLLAVRCPPTVTSLVAGCLVCGGLHQPSAHKHHFYHAEGRLTLDFG